MIYLKDRPFKSPLSRLVFGGAALSGEGRGYGFGPMSENEAEHLVKFAFDQGVNTFDTAPIYGFGLSEERLGRYLPQDAFIVTKGGVDWHSSKRVNMTNDPQVIERMLHESLKRLKREKIDLYMIHWPDPRVDIRLALEVLKKAKEAGKINDVGLCNTNLNDLKLAQEIMPISFIQSELNVLNSKAFDLLEEKWKDYISMSWGTFDKGILTQRVHEKRIFDRDDCRSWAPWWNKKEVAQKIKRVELLKTILKNESFDLAHFCISYNLNYFGISQILIGAKSIEDLKLITEHVDKPIPMDRLSEIVRKWKDL